MECDICIISPPHFKQCLPNLENTGSIEQYCYALAKQFSKMGYKVVLWGNGNASSDNGFKIGYYFKTSTQNYYKLLPQQVANHEIIHVSKCLNEVKAKLFLNHCISGIPILETLKPYNKFSANTTLHWDLKEDRVKEYINAFSDHDYVILSKHQKKYLKGRNYKIIHPGVDLNFWKYNEDKDDYLFFIGRLIPEKGIDLAIKVAQKSNSKLLIAGRRMDERYPKFFEESIAPHLNEKIRYLGEVSGEKKKALFTKAKAVICLGRWAEPFGLVMLEAVFSGTPVIAWNPGASNCMIVDKVNGFIVDGKNEVEILNKAVKSIQNIDKLKPQEVYDEVANEYSLEQSAKRYLDFANLKNNI
jgi:glycosyltransferase involved in cell wall biosynthesis